VATDAADVGLACGERSKSGCVSAWQVSHLAIILGRVLGRIEDLGYISAAGYVFAARAVAVLAGHACAVAMLEKHLLVRIVGEFLETSS